MGDTGLVGVGVDSAADSVIEHFVFLTRARVRAHDFRFGFSGPGNTRRGLRCFLFWGEAGGQKKEVPFCLSPPPTTSEWVAVAR